MKNSYDYTKDEKYKSYEQFVYKSLIELGFRVTNVGTMYLKDLILFAYFNNYYEINVTKIIKDFMHYKKMDYISYRTFINCIDYSIKKANNKVFQIVLKKTLKIESNYYTTTKYFVTLFY